MDLATTYFVPTIIILLIAVSGIYAILKKWVNAVFFIGMGIFLGVMEFVSVALTGTTISGAHWMIAQTYPAIGLLLIILIGAIFLVVVMHLAKVSIERIKEKKEKD